MAKDKLTEYDATAANNTVVGDVNLAENSCLPSDLNNAVREVMSHQKEAFGSGTPLYVDQTNNRVGIGTTAPDSNLKIKSTGAATLRLDGGAVASSVGPLIVGEHADTDAFYIGTNSVVLGESSNQDVVIYGADSSSGNIRFYAGASTETARIRDGGGITFNGDTAAANALDDYEEGTWTPTLPNGHTGAFTVANAIYTKIGRQVYIGCHLSSLNIPSNSTEFRIGGLPYSVHPNVFHGAGSITFVRSHDIAAFHMLPPTPQQSGTELYFHRGDGTNATVINSQLSGMTEFIFAVVYQST